MKKSRTTFVNVRAWSHRCRTLLNKIKKKQQLKFT
jgi:hypothetical protein